ncbi:MAG: hypothetical protein ACM3XO_04685 [Bacteroidota bacterium]
MSSSFLLIFFVVLLVGALLAAWAGIRSIQSARSVVFYRTRQAKMSAGRQWLAFSLVMMLFALGSVFFVKPLAGKISSTTIPTASFAGTSTFPPTGAQTNTAVPVQTLTEAVVATGTVTASSLVTSSLSTSWAGMLTRTGTALALGTQQRGTFIAYLSVTPTPSRTPLPTWTRTPSLTPRPTYTASQTRTPRPTITHLPTQTPIPTWTSSPTRAPVTPSPTRTPTPTRTPSLTSTPSATRTSTPTRTPAS